MPRASSRIPPPRPINGSTLRSAHSLAYSTGACASPSRLRMSRISRRIWIKRFALQGRTLAFDLPARASCATFRKTEVVSEDEHVPKYQDAAQFVLAAIRAQAFGLH